MIKHIVMWNVLGDSPEDKRSVATQVKTGFESLLGQIPGLTHLEVGIDISRVSYACDMVLYSEFVDEHALAGYATHPAHLEVRDRISGMRTARFQVDYATLEDSEP